MEAVAAESDVSPADKPDATSVNRRRLEKLDADITNTLKTMVKCFPWHRESRLPHHCRCRWRQGR
jgi:hypothetical protein